MHATILANNSYVPILDYKKYLNLNSESIGFVPACVL